MGMGMGSSLWQRGGTNEWYDRTSAWRTIRANRSFSSCGRFRLGPTTSAARRATTRCRSWLVALAVPARPAPAAAPLRAQAANALTALDVAEAEARRRKLDPSHLESGPVWEWAARNLAAVSERLLSPAERIERAVAPWSTYVVLPLFAFSATGVSFAIHLSSPERLRILAGTVLGLVLGKPIGILLASTVAAVTRVATPLHGVTFRQFVGAACLCGVGDTLALLMADRAFTPDEAGVAKLGVLAESILAGVLGTAILALPAAVSKPTERRVLRPGGRGIGRGRR